MTSSRGLRINPSAPSLRCGSSLRNLKPCDLFVKGPHERNSVHQRIDGSHAEDRKYVSRPALNEQGTEPISVAVDWNLLWSANLNSHSALSALVVPERPSIGCDWVRNLLLLFETVAERCERVFGGHCSGLTVRFQRVYIVR